ncbi:MULTISPECIES: cupin domain-containing protein [Kocuria]|uniref:cupin domain-containing protein n=1 Tax=Kocuria TaxID=57493 RepID=UPI00073D252A|nr:MULTISPECIES: cupin domain-containing protein [Kocuria]MBK4121163.1 cupin domain-containing protein [Kocuria rhizophila]MDV5998034.1 cupin domain-containing protein [Kocuria rhizophila]HAG63353.1 cupin [Kocuria sp.]
MDANSLTTLARTLLEQAHEVSSGRAAHNLHGGRGRRLQQTVIALVRGEKLKEHENPGEATLQVIEGRVELAAGEDPVTLSAGEHAVIPQQRHSLHAQEDSVVLLSLVNNH